VQVDFYHLAAHPLERVLPRIAERVLASGGRLLIVAGDEALAAGLDQSLWSYAPESFLPHGRAGGESEADEPVLISATPTAANGARNIALADGIWREEALTFDRVFHFFDAETVEAARAAWRTLDKQEGVEPRYWTQDEAGRWSRVR
jgi:DNA polymerase-3 subunit chi